MWQLFIPTKLLSVPAVYRIDYVTMDVVLLKAQKVG